MLNTVDDVNDFPSKYFSGLILFDCAFFGLSYNCVKWQRQWPCSVMYDWRLVCFLFGTAISFEPAHNFFLKIGVEEWLLFECPYDIHMKIWYVCTCSTSSAYKWINTQKQNGYYGDLTYVIYHFYNLIVQKCICYKTTHWISRQKEAI